MVTEEFFELCFVLAAYPDALVEIFGIPVSVFPDIDFLPVFRCEITVNRIGFPVFPQGYPCRNTDTPVCSAAAVSPFFTIAGILALEFYIGDLHPVKRIYADIASDPVVFPVNKRDRGMDTNR